MASEESKFEMGATESLKLQFMAFVESHSQKASPDYAENFRGALRRGIYKLISHEVQLIPVDKVEFDVEQLPEGDVEFEGQADEMFHAISLFYRGAQMYEVILHEDQFNVGTEELLWFNVKPTHAASLLNALTAAENAGELVAE